MQKKVNYSDFTEKELKQMDLQCGPCNSWLGWLVPELWFNRQCAQHDIDYAAGHTKADKIKADNNFYNNMIKRACKEPFWKRWFIVWAARKYYTAVVELGDNAFCYSNRYSTKAEIINKLRKK